MISLNDVIEANKLLMTMGGDDQLPRIASAAIERSLDLQHRVDRALTYAAETPPNSMHARQMARILDGSITIDDELREVPEPRGLREQQVHAALHSVPVPAARAPAKPKKKVDRNQAGLAGRSTAQRKAFRDWVAEQGYELPTFGRVPQEYVDMYDEAMDAERRQRAEARRTGRTPEAAAGTAEPALFTEQADADHE